MNPQSLLASRRLRGKQRLRISRHGRHDLARAAGVPTSRTPRRIHSFARRQHLGHRMDIPVVPLGSVFPVLQARPARRSQDSGAIDELPQSMCAQHIKGASNFVPEPRRKSQPRRLRRPFGPHPHPAPPRLFTTAHSKELRHLTTAQRNFVLRGTRAANDRIVYESVQPKTNKDKARTWRRRLGLCTKAGIVDPLLVRIPDATKELVIRSFLVTYQVAHWDRSGRILGTNQKALAGTTVRTAALHLAAAFRDSFQPSPLHVSDGSRLFSTVAALFKAIDNVDDPPNRQKAITPKFLHYLQRLRSKQTDPCSIDQAVDLITGGFFFATRPCEIVRTKDPGRTRTLEIRNLHFRTLQQKPISPLSPSFEADAEFVTVTWDDQKNRKKSDSRTQRRTNDPLLCPVTSLGRAARRVVLTVPGAGPITLLCSVYNPSSHLVTLLSDEFTLKLLCSTCAMFGGKPVFGFHPHEIGNRSIRSGTAMALFLKDHSTAKVMILGRWSSDAFLVYIRPQVLEWTNNMPRDMASFESFLDVGLYGVASASDPHTRRRTIHLNGGNSVMELPTFHLQDLVQNGSRPFGIERAEEPNESSVAIRHSNDSIPNTTSTTVGLGPCLLAWKNSFGGEAFVC
jgi:hypothetical protein